LVKCPDPICSSCMYGQMTRRSWRTRADPLTIAHQRTITQPGQCVSIVQMQSPVPGLIAQLKGVPVNARYNSATVFTDHYSDVTYVHLEKSTNAQETLEAKQAFERWANQHSVKINHYHANNGRFAETVFMADVARRGQTISFCGVNAHFQNGKAERRIRLLQDMARSQLLHAMHRWPVAITTNLWPYAVTNICNCLNDCPTKTGEKSRIEMFTGSAVRPNLSHHHHIGLPLYALD
jgi:hypothetical protein